MSKIPLFTYNQKLKGAIICTLIFILFIYSFKNQLYIFVFFMFIFVIDISIVWVICESGFELFCVSWHSQALQCQISAQTCSPGQGQLQQPGPRDSRRGGPASSQSAALL